MKCKKKLEKNILAKVKNNVPIRILYKKTGQPPKVKIIYNVFRLKQAIIKKHLDIIPYEKLYIICNNQKSILKVNPNIILTFSSIYGDIILIDIDKKEREFKGLSQENILWYSQDLINKSSNNSTFDSIKKPSVKNFTEFCERDFEIKSYRNSANFENTLINVLSNIELILKTFLKDGDKK